MKSFMNRSLLLLAIGAAAMLSVVSSAWGAGVSCVCRAAKWLFEPLATMAPPEPASAPRQVVQLVRAVAFKLRLIKRDRLDVRPGYRLCPSI